MNKDIDVFSKLVIQGFTINPIKDKHSFKDIIFGLCTCYKEFHICDYGENPITHKNYLGKLVFDNIFVDYIDNKKNGIISFVVLENGYFTITLKYDVYPAEIVFDLFLYEKILDISIILDHLSAPPTKSDGFGMFDYTYSLSYITKNKNILQKDQNQVLLSNEGLSNNLKNKINHDETLNELKNIECYFCNNKATINIFFDTPRKVVMACDIHKNNGSTKEIEFNGKYDLEVIKINGIEYGKNVKSVE